MGTAMPLAQQTHQLTDERLMTDQQQVLLRSLGQIAQHVVRLIIRRQPGCGGYCALKPNLRADQCGGLLGSHIRAGENTVQWLPLKQRGHQTHFSFSGDRQRTFRVGGSLRRSLAVAHDPDSHSASSSDCRVQRAPEAGQSLNGQGFCSLTPVR